MPNEYLVKNGFKEDDVWNYSYWFADTSSRMLKILAKKHMGFPASIDLQWYEEHKDILPVESYDEWVVWPLDKNSEGYKLREKANKECSEEWTEILYRMSFLLHELDEDKSSMAEKEDKILTKLTNVYDEFIHKYGNNGKQLKSDELKEKEKKDGFIRMMTPRDLPDDDPLRIKYEKVSKELYEYTKAHFEYRDKCKNEFMELFNKYFWELWD